MTSHDAVKLNESDKVNGCVGVLVTSWDAGLLGDEENYDDVVMVCDGDGLHSVMDSHSWNVEMVGGWRTSPVACMVLVGTTLSSHMSGGYSLPQVGSLENKNKCTDVKLIIVLHHT